MGVLEVGAGVAVCLRVVMFISTEAFYGREEYMKEGKEEEGGVGKAPKGCDTEEDRDLEEGVRLCEQHHGTTYET